MKIIIVGTCLGVGGAEKVMVDLADGFIERGHSVRIIVLSEPVVLKPMNPLVEVACLNASSIWGISGLMIKLCRELVSYRPDIVHAHLFHAIILSRLACFFVKVPKLVTTVHSTRVGGWIRRLLYRFTDRLSDVSTSVGDDVAQRFYEQRAARPGTIRIVNNGISLSQFQKKDGARELIERKFNLPKDHKLLVSVGRLEPPKDYPNLLSALSKLMLKEPNFVALIVGEGSLHNELIKQAESLGIESRLRFVGVRRDVPYLLSAADVYVLSSAWEGLPMAVGEAMACECTVVATDCGGVRELLSDAGFIVPIRNSELLADRLAEVLALPGDEHRDMGRRARQRIEHHFSLNVSVSQWLEIYTHG